MGQWTEDRVFMPAVLSTVDCRAPTKDPGVGPLQPTVGNTVGVNAPLSVRRPVGVVFFVH